MKEQLRGKFPVQSVPVATEVPNEERLIGVYESAFRSSVVGEANSLYKVYQRLQRSQTTTQLATSQSTTPTLGMSDDVFHSRVVCKAKALYKVYQRLHGSQTTTMLVKALSVDSMMMGCGILLRLVTFESRDSP